jgi:hypothetical protein
MSESEGGRGNVRSLTDALRRARIADADRTDVAVELREAERARLDMLADELRGVFSELPPDDEQFVNAVVPGDPPRLWIDATSFVVIGRDRRIYRFLKDTRLGRTVILETASLDDMADAVTNYVAERVIERERALEGDWLVKRGTRGPVRERGRLNAPAGEAFDRGGLGWVIAAFLLGVLIGAAALLAYAWVRVPI